MTTVFIDIDTQLDFLFPAGALYVPQAERILPAIARLNHFAAAHSIPLISTVDAHTENDTEFAQWPHHCVAGATGQHKPEATLLARRITIPSGTGLQAGRPSEGGISVEGFHQIIVEKQSVDALQAPNFIRVLDQLGAGRYVLYGVVTEICVLHAARGLLQRGHAVELVADAIEALTSEGSRRAIEEMVARGGRISSVEAITGGHGR